MTAPDVAGIAGRLTKAQQALILEAVVLLDWMAGEGKGVPNPTGDGYIFADDVLYELANEFMPDWDGEDTYPAAVRAHLQGDAS